LNKVNHINTRSALLESSRRRRSAPQNRPSGSPSNSTRDVERSAVIRERFRTETWLQRGLSDSRPLERNFSPSEGSPNETLAVDVYRAHSRAAGQRADDERSMRSRQSRRSAASVGGRANFLMTIGQETGFDCHPANYDFVLAEPDDERHSSSETADHRRRSSVQRNAFGVKSDCT
jgi:hypothetical protein